MSDRTPLNSFILKNKFPEVYQEFFSKCQLVVSSPHFFTWAGEYVGYFGGLMTLQKLPLRMYVGFEICSENIGKNIEFSHEAKSYSSKQNKFIDSQFDSLALSRLTEFIAENFKHNKESIKIHLLSETPFGGSGSVGALCSAMAVAVNLYNKTLDLNALSNWEKQETKELLDNKKYGFDKVFKLACKMQTAFRGGISTGSTILVCLLSSKYPIFYQLKKGSTQEDIKFLGGRIEEVFKLSHLNSWPIDFGLLYLGEPKGTMPYTTQQLQDEMEEVGYFCQNNFENGLLNNTSLTWDSCLEVMNFLSSQILFQLVQVLKSGSREDSQRALLRALDKHQALFLLLGVLPPMVDSVTSIIHHESRKIDDLGAGLKSVSTTKKDIILFVLPQNRLRDILLKLLPKINKELVAQAQIGYASWIDGIEEKAIIVEQYIPENIFSPFISSNSIFIKEFKGNLKTRQVILSHEEFQKQKNGVDLIIEQGTGKIFIKGKALTSKELHSSKATCAVIGALLSKSNKEINSFDLPDSAYSIDRYEMQGKIILPLAKVFEQKTKKKLPLGIKGSVANFSIKLEPGSYTIWLK